MVTGMSGMNGLAVSQQVTGQFDVRIKQGIEGD